MEMNRTKTKLRTTNAHLVDTASIVDLSQVELWKIQEELKSFSCLFTNLDPSKSIPAWELNGMGLALGLASEKIEHIKDMLSGLIVGENS